MVSATKPYDALYRSKRPFGALIATYNPDMTMITHGRGIVTYRMSDGAIRPFANPEGERDAIAYNDGLEDFG